MSISPFRALFLSLLLSPLLAAQQLQDLVNIDFVADVRLFTVMSAINAGGFDYEAGPLMHPVRGRVRDKLKSLNPELARRLRDFYVAHHAPNTPQREIAGYTSLALLLSDPPRFEITLPPPDIPSDVREVIGFEQVLPPFYQEAGLEQLWSEVRPEYEAEIEKYKPVVLQSVLQSQQYLRTETRMALDRQILFMPDLMSAYGLSNSRIVKNLYYLIVGPADSPEKNLHNVRHEYLHFLLDPIMEKNGLAIVQQQEVLKLIEDRPEVLERFGKDLRLLNTESLIEAVQLRIEQPQDIQAQLSQLYVAGNVLIYHYYEQLEEFEKATISFPEYLPSVIQAFSLKREAARRERLSAERAAVRQKQEQEAQRARDQAERSDMLGQVGLLLQKKDHAAAERLLLALRGKKPDDPPVLFSLGQIELQKQNPAAAEAFLKKVIDHPAAPPWMGAWSRVYLARAYLMLDRLGDARDQLRQVTELSGDLRGAAEEAGKRLADLPQP